LIFVMGCLFAPSIARSETGLMPCAQRPHFIDPPWVSAQYYCAEEVIRDERGGELSFTSLAVASDGTLYATRPFYGQVLALTDTDGDLLPDSPRVVIEGLTLPNGLAYHAGALYISGASHIYRWADDRLETLVDDIPAGAGFWTGGLVIGPDNRIYVGVGASCDFCVAHDPERGAILTFALDGSDRQLVATGLRQPADVTFRDDVLWTVDTARDDLFDPSLDELDRVAPDANFGWPYCVGMGNLADFPGSFDCSSATPPAYTFATHSNPLGMVTYAGDAFPNLQGDLLITFGGSVNQAHLEGFTLVNVHFDDAGNPISDHILLPEVPSPNPQWNDLDLQKIHYQASGFWPHRPFDVTVSPEGWIYVSSGGGRIWALRPR
jgi:glucose/arabinose dehydrogenase